MTRTSDELAFLRPLVGDLCVVETVYQHDGKIVAALGYRFDREKTNTVLRDRLELSGYTYTLVESNDHILLTIDRRRSWKIPPVNLILFALTAFSVYVIPVFLRTQLEASSLSDAVGRTLSALSQGDGLVFSLALMSILLVHEMGHFVASRRRGIITSWPYFIPAPNIIGTFGAIIKSKTPFWNRRDLIEVGAAGPIAGWLVAVGWLVYGLSESMIVPAAGVPFGQMAFLLEGESILTRIIVTGLLGTTPPGTFYVFTEAAFAGWVGLLVTAINLLPVGQFDGGHITYGLVRQKQGILGWITIMILFALGFQSMLWWVFAVFGLIFRVQHPPTLDDTRRPGPAAVAMALAALVILLLSFTPIPFR
ncbi:MAG: site-2 protease family protein [Candidatus Zixiibacteriota bacterium]|nr:MAG: site-2 protease family protein [candidate division Zixibacteria bacterium]